ncbi:SOS response-associated peptidase family protein [Ottowia sp.]|uniref:SOS response-associated peptidase n=1 Tax=Ottowia sp. TaxID=1898956 RepID=UPI002CCB7942|nr:SOS response-associated peptidase family protein [Ottowia sp.]MCZ2439780.1 SOS response-associated peptidase [Burkholderiales bacterium]HNR83526.1 SOS response-associated peptidase family protein [Ottowia sp.]
MCNRYVSPDQAAIERFWHIGGHNPLRWWEPNIYPRAPGPFIRAAGGDRDLVVGQWGLIPDFAKTPKLAYQTNNARSEELARKASYRRPWARGQRCIIPATSFDEPCWETGRNVWWTFRRRDGQPWGLAGLWNTWTDDASGELVESYTMLTINADTHPLMRRMHKPDPRLRPHEQDKRSVIPIESGNTDQWLHGTLADAARLLALAPVEVFEATPLGPTNLRHQGQSPLL